MRKTSHACRAWASVVVDVLLPWLATAVDAPMASADVVVLANRTGSQLTLRFQASGPAQQLVLPVDDVRPMFVDGRAQVEFAVPGQSKRYQLDSNSAYFFGRDARGVVDMQKIGLGEGAAAAPPQGLPTAAPRAPLVIIPVKIMVDEEEPAQQFYWEQRLRRRIEAASDILERHGRVRLQVTSTGKWNSDNSIRDFNSSLAEFEQEVDPQPARLAIGFTSQFQAVRGRVHVAGTRGPMHTHILVREGSPNLSEPERLEFLVHELGHYLGASHSPERSSVMRPMLGDDRAGRSDFQIRFDPVNTLIIAMVGEEMRRRNVQRFDELSGDTKRRLQRIYETLTRAMPHDPAGGQYLRIAETAANAPLVASAKKVLRALVLAASANQAGVSAEPGIDAQSPRPTGDALSEHLVRRAAAAADSLPDETAPSAFLLAVAIGLDDSGLLLSHAGTRNVVGAVESPDERLARLAILGNPTMRERRDLLARFFASACLANTLGADSARNAGLTREFETMRQGGRFSFALLMADRAGIRFGEAVSKRRVTAVVSRFTSANFMPPVDDLPADLPAGQFAARYGAADDSRFQLQLFIIDERINNLPPYRTPGLLLER